MDLDIAKSKRIYAALICALMIAAAMFLVRYFEIAVVFLPFAAVFAVAYCGYVPGGLAAVAGIGIGFFFGTLMPALFAAAFLPLAFAAGYMIREKKRFRNSVIVSSVAALAGTVLAVWILSLLTGSSIVDYLVNYAGAWLKTRSPQEVTVYYSLIRMQDLISGAVTQAAVESTPAADAILKIMALLRDAMNLMLVFFIMLYAMLMGLLAYLIPRAAAKRNGAVVAPIPPFSEYTLPRRFWLGALLSNILAMIGASYAWPAFDILQVTIYNVYAFVFTIQALSLLDFFYKTRKMGTGLRVVLHILAVAVFNMILPFVGLIENAFDIRKRIQTRKAV